MLHLPNSLLRAQVPSLFRRSLVRLQLSLSDTSNSSYAKFPFEQLLRETDRSLSSIKQSLNLGILQHPYLELNNLSAAVQKNLVHELRQNLVGSYERFAQNGDYSALTTVTPADYLQPRLSIITPLALQVHMNVFPTKVAESKGLTSKSQILQSLFTDLLHQQYLQLVVAKVPANSAKSGKHDIVSSTGYPVFHPADWFPDARKMKRKITMHVGPTNSGKTYNSLKKFATAKSGYYAGPLRLLAREVHDRFQKDGVPCNLITGEEVVPSVDEHGAVSRLSSGTIEMIPLHTKMDICVIDEIQMIGDEQRGMAWTNALLGVQAKEVHLCGEESAVNLVLKMAESTGDEVEIIRYGRLGKLTAEKKPLKDVRNLKPGDCVIAFSKAKILQIKCHIEQKTKYKVGIIYGALPPEIRSMELARFNSGEYDILVASDAIGMGLNLKIKRIVFWSIMKFNGTEMAKLSISATKQIAGRAGRFSSDAGELEGFVTAFNGTDLKYISTCMKGMAPNLTHAVVRPPNEFWSMYCLNFDTPVALLVAMNHFIHSTLRHPTGSIYRFGNFENQLLILDLLTKHGLGDIPIDDQLRLALAPINLSVALPMVADVAVQFMNCVHRNESRNVFDFNFLSESILSRELSQSVSADRVSETLLHLETDHKLVLVFMWLSQRWPTLFVDKESAQEVKTLIEKRISEELMCLREAYKKDKKKRHQRRR